MEQHKPLMVVQCPIATRSGYGERSRDLVRALIALDKYNIKIVGTRWGGTPLNALTAADQDITSRLLTQPLTQQPDIYIQITVPNEFQAVGKYNIGITAGIETTVCDPAWIEGCNKMDLILVSSEHAKSVFLNSQYEKRDQNTNASLGMLRLEKPIEVLFEGIRLDTFTKEYNKEPKIEELFSKIKEDFCYLFVGHWLPGAYGEDRKNVGVLIKLFYEAFKNKTNAPALILKTSGGMLSVTDSNIIKQKIEQIQQTMDTKILPNVYLAYGDFTDAEMNDLYNHPKVKAHVSFTKGEGFGRPLMEAALTNKPIIASKWSGHLDFLTPEANILVEGELTKIHPSAVWQGILNEGSEWFTINHGMAVAYLKDVYKNYKTYTDKSRKNYHHIKTNFSFDKMKEKLDAVLTSRLPEFPKQVSIVLPKLKKVE